MVTKQPRSVHLTNGFIFITSIWVVLIHHGLNFAAITSKNKWCNLPEHKGNNNQCHTSSTYVQFTTPLSKCSTHRHKFEACKQCTNYFSTCKCKCWLVWHPNSITLPWNPFIVPLPFLLEKGINQENAACLIWSTSPSKSNKTWGNIKGKNGFAHKNIMHQHLQFSDTLYIDRSYPHNRCGCNSHCSISLFLFPDPQM